MRPARAPTIAFAAAAVALAGAAAPSGAAAQGTVPGCTPATNIEAIIDDSASMAFRDFHELRRTSLELFTRLGANGPKTLGAVEFGSVAETLFAPRPIATGWQAMIAGLRARIDADKGGTDYDAGFLKAFGDNPSATARIFLTDSATDGVYRNSHRGGGRTYVVGLGLGAPGGGDATANRLLQIANETGGIYFPGVQPARLQATFNLISAAAACLPPPYTSSTRIFTRSGQTSVRGPRVRAATRKLDLALSWGEPGNDFSFSSVQALGRGNRVIADLTGIGRPRKLRVRRSTGETFQSLIVNKPRGTRRVRLRVAAIRLFRREPAIAQLTQRARSPSTSSRSRSMNVASMPSASSTARPM